LREFSSKRSSAELVEQGLKLHQNNMFSEARVFYEQALDIEPGCFDALQLLGVMSAQVGEFLQAVDYLSQAIEINQKHFACHSNLGNALRELGHLDEAISSYDEAIKLKSDYAEAYNNRGIALQDLNRLNEAIASYDRAIEFKPDYAEAYNNRGVALRDLGRFNEAIASYGKAVELIPSYAEAYYNAGITFYENKRFDEAISCYDKAIEFRPEYSEAYNNRGIALQDLRRLNEAIKSYERAIQLKPDYAEAFNNRGIALQDLNRLNEAIVSYDRAIELKPDYAEAYFNAGIAFYENMRFDEAIKSYDRAIELKPDYAEAFFSRGNVLADIGLQHAARLDYGSALDIFPEYKLARWAIPFSYVPPIFRHGEDPIFSREQLSSALDELSLWFSEDRLDGASSVVGSHQPFYLAYYSVSNKKILDTYGKICRRIMSHWQEKNKLIPLLRVSSNKIKVGIIGENINNHSVWNAITKGLVTNLDRTKFEIHIFHLGDVFDAETNIAKNYCDTFTSNQTSILSWANQIIDKNIDVLIYPEVGMHLLTIQMANLRLAPIQIASWGHPETTGLPTIDFYFSAALFEEYGAESEYTEHLIRLPNLGCHYSQVVIKASEFDLSKYNLNKSQPILLCPGTLFKYHPNNDYVLIEIAKRLKNCKFVFLASNESWTAIFKERLEICFQEAGLRFEDYVTIIPWLKPEEFHGLMRLADVYLDTIGFSGFNTAIQAVDCGLPIVTKEDRFMRGRLAAGILKRMGMHDLVAKSNEQYIDLVIDLINNLEFRDKVVESMTSNRHILYQDMEPIRAIENFLIAECVKL